MSARVGQALAVVAKAPPAATKAERIELAKNASVDDAVAVVFAACLRHWTANEAAALSGLDPEGVHEMRVALRRIRAALSDFREIIPVAQVAWLKRETKWLLTSLGTARDWDVFLSELLAPVEAGRPWETLGWPNCGWQPRRKGRRAIQERGARFDHRVIPRSWRGCADGCRLSPGAKVATEREDLSTSPQ